MDLNLSPADIAFRDMIRAEIPPMVPDDIKERVENLQHLRKEDYLRWQAILDERGWATPAWPAEFGGPGWNAAVEARARAGVVSAHVRIPPARMARNATVRPAWVWTRSRRSSAAPAA